MIYIFPLIRWDAEGFPEYDRSQAQKIPFESEPPVPLNPPPGCFGNGPGPLKNQNGVIPINTNKFVTYAQASTKE